MSNYLVHSATYAAESVSANTDITSEFVPSNAVGFTIVGFEINCSDAAVIDVNGTDKFQCAPASSGYSARVNLDGGAILDIQKIKVETACNINACTVFFTYDYIKRTLAPPLASVPAGAYPLPLYVELTAEEGTTIYYTNNGDAPSAESTLYTGAIKLESGKTIKAIATKEGCVTSSACSYTYTQAKVATPTADPAAGVVANGTEIELSCATEGAVIHYTRNGSTPTESSTIYTGPIKITAYQTINTNTIKAIAIASGYENSSVLAATYTISE